MIPCACSGGGFLYNSLCPLEINLNYCSIGCSYCFANMSAPQRKANVTQLFKLLGELNYVTKDNKFKRKSYAAQLLRARYPVTLSNLVDPLAKSNWDLTREIIKLLNAADIPIDVLTKWGSSEITKEFFGLLDMPTPIYTSISSLNADLLSKIEPNAAPPLERFANLKTAKDQGHSVTVGINPLYEPWLGDPRPLLEECVKAGVSGVWVHELYFSRSKLKNMTPRARKTLGEDTIQAGLSKSNHEYKEHVIQLAKEYGLATYTSTQGEPSAFWEPSKKILPKSFPIMQDFVNWAHSTLQPGDPIYLSDWLDFFSPKLPEGEYGLRNHINAVTVPALLNGKWIPQRMTYDELLAYAWIHHEIAFSPVNTHCFQYAADDIDPETKTWINVVDENEDPIIIFNPDGRHDKYCFTDNHKL